MPKKSGLVTYFSCDRLLPKVLKKVFFADKQARISPVSVARLDGTSTEVGRYRLHKTMRGTDI